MRAKIVKFLERDRGFTTENSEGHRGRGQPRRVQRGYRFLLEEFYICGELKEID